VSHVICQGLKRNKYDYLKCISTTIYTMYKSEIRRYKIQLQEKDKIIDELKAELIKVKDDEKDNLRQALNHIKLLINLLPQGNIKKDIFNLT
jgi:predicted AlkP superfamily phosphohydrolase/phosphomutase